MNTQERKKKKIVIASVLKPADEPRMFSKIAKSLSSFGHEVHCIGFPPSVSAHETTIDFHSFGSFNRFSLKRLLIPFLFFRKCVVLKPDTIIVCTHELLGWGILAKYVTKARLIYDVQENYFLNILYTGAFATWLRFPLALYVRTKEKLASLFIDFFFLAEEVYARQLSFVSVNHHVFENRFRQHDILKRNTAKGFHRLLFTGTLADTTGIWQAIEFAKKLHAVDGQVTLTIAGYAPQQKTRTRLSAIQQQHSFIQVKAGHAPLPHADIVQEILQADFGILWYPYNKSTEGRIPTKYFEYAGLGLRMIIAGHRSIAKKVNFQKNGVLIDPAQDVNAIIHQLQSFEPDPASSEHYWETYESLLQEVV